VLDHDFRWPVLDGYGSTLAILFVNHFYFFQVLLGFGTLLLLAGEGLGQIRLGACVIGVLLEV
jgi:hypothetical protein